MPANPTLLSSGEAVADRNAPRLRILIALETSGGGSGRHALDLAEGLASRGHEIAVLYSPVRAESAFLDRLHDLPVTPIRVPMQRSIGPSDWKAFQAVRHAVHNYGPFHIHHAHSSKAGAFIRALPGRTPKIYTPHAFKTMDPGSGRLPRLIFRAIEAGLGRIATDTVVVVSAAERDHALNVLRLPNSKVVRVINGVERRSSRSRTVAREELGLSPKDFLVGFVGRLTTQKNPQLFLRAMAEVRKLNTDACAIMMGDGDLMQPILDLRAALGLVEAVHIVTGRDAADFFSGMDCLAMTSRYEAMPYVMLEAIAAGLPLISTSVGGVEEAILDGVSGYVVDSDPRAIAERLLQLGENELLRRKLGRGALALSQRYSIDAMVSATEDVYLSALGSRRSISQAQPVSSVVEMIGA